MAAAKRSRRPARPETSSEHDDKPVGRPIWSGSISFGLLQIPVSMYSAEARNDISFHQLDRRDLSPIGYQRVNKATGEKVAWADIVKGYEVEKGHFVVMEDADFKKAAVEATQSIDIQDFVDIEAIHPAFYETPYYLAPTKRSAKAYAILREALRKKKKAAVATFVMRQREHLAAVFPQEDVLLLEVLRFPHEIRSTEHLPLPAVGGAGIKMHPKELEMAEQLVEGMTSDWEPSKYKDDYRDVLLAAIDQKARTGKVKAVEEPAKATSGSGNVVDLMALLKKSLEKTQGAKPAVRKAASGKRKGGGKAA